MKSYLVSDGLRKAIESLFDDPSVAYAPLGVERSDPDTWYEESCSSATAPIQRAAMLRQTLEKYIIQMAREHEELGCHETTETLRMQALGLCLALRELICHFPELERPS